MKFIFAAIAAIALSLPAFSQQQAFTVLRTDTSTMNEIRVSSSLSTWRDAQDLLFSFEQIFVEAAVDSTVLHINLEGGTRAPEVEDGRNYAFLEVTVSDSTMRFDGYIRFHNGESAKFLVRLTDKNHFQEKAEEFAIPAPTVCIIIYLSSGEGEVNLDYLSVQQEDYVLEKWVPIFAK